MLGGCFVQGVCSGCLFRVFVQGVCSGRLFRVFVQGVRGLFCSGDPALLLVVISASNREAKGFQRRGAHIHFSKVLLAFNRYRSTHHTHNPSQFEERDQELPQSKGCCCPALRQRS